MKIRIFNKIYLKILFEKTDGHFVQATQVLMPVTVFSSAGDIGGVHL